MNSTQSCWQPLKLGTRKSPLALWQAEYVRRAIIKLHPNQKVQIIPYQTSGDKIQNKPLYEIGGKGLFTKELEIALKKKEIDFAVQSIKDIPGKIEQCFAIPIVFARENPLDAFISLQYKNLDDLPARSTIGTSSPRRTAQLLSYNKNLHILPLRGNVDTRIELLKKKKLDAILLAVAGLKRMGLTNYITQILPPRISLPAVGQGMIGLESLKENQELITYLKDLNHQPTYIQFLAERSFLSSLNGSCNSPIAAYAKIEHQQLTLEAFAGNLTGETVLRNKISGPKAQAAQLGEMLAKRFIQEGIQHILPL